MLFLGCLLVLSFSVTPYRKIADEILITVRLSIVLLVSVLVVREQWNHVHPSDMGQGGAPTSILRRLRRWYYDEP